jgi:hypothetical protein
MQSSVDFLFTVSLLNSSHLSGSDLNLSIFLTSDVPIFVVRQWIPFFAKGLSCIMSGSMLDDETLTLISNTPAASSLRTLRAPGCFVTDASAKSWPRFAMLEDVNISNSKSIGMETLRAISSISTIRCLRVTNLPKCSWSDISELLASECMPLLEEVHLDTYHVFGEPPNLGWLRKRHETLKAVCNSSIGATRMVPGQNNFNWFKAIHETLPELEKLFRPHSLDLLIESEWFLLPYLSNIRRSVNVGIQSREDLLRLSKLIPRVESLSISSEAENLGDDLSIFPSVTELSLRGKFSSKIKVWPTGLVELMIMESLSDPDPQAETNWIRNLCSLPNLTSLALGNRTHLDAPIALALVSHLTNLRTLSLPVLVFADPQQPLLPLTNLPYLRLLHTAAPITWVDPAKIYLPSLPTMAGFHIPWAHCSLEQLPNAETLGAYEDVRCGVSVDDFVSVAQRFAGQLSSVNDHAPIPLPIVLQMNLLTQICFLRPITEPHAEQMLRHLPLLRSIKCYLDNTVYMPDFEWLSHKILQHLDISSAYEWSTETPSLPRLEFTSSTLPCLQSLRIKLERHVEDINISSLSNLRVIYLAGITEKTSRLPIKFALSGSDFVSVLDLSCVELKTLDVSQMRNLTQIKLLSCTVPALDEDIRFNLAPACSISVVDDSWSPVESDQERLFLILQSRAGQLSETVTFPN